MSKLGILVMRETTFIISKARLLRTTTSLCGNIPIWRKLTDQQTSSDNPNPRQPIVSLSTGLCIVSLDHKSRVQSIQSDHPFSSFQSFSNSYKAPQSSSKVYSQVFKAPQSSSASLHQVFKAPQSSSKVYPQVFKALHQVLKAL